MVFNEEMSLRVYLKLITLLCFDVGVRPESDQVITVWDAVLLQLTEIDCYHQKTASTSLRVSYPTSQSSLISYIWMSSSISLCKFADNIRKHLKLWNNFEQRKFDNKRAMISSLNTMITLICIISLNWKVIVQMLML
jgi:hypothetical protein